MATQKQFTLIVLDDLDVHDEIEKYYLIESKDKKAFDECFEQARKEYDWEYISKFLEKLEKLLGAKGVKTYVMDVSHKKIED